MFPAVISCVPVVSATARVAPDSAVRHQFAVRADFGFVRGKDVGRRGDPPVLDDLDPHHPAVFGRLDPGDALGLFPGQLGDLAQACLTRPGGREAGVAIAAGTPSAVPPAVATVQLWLLLRKLVLRLLGKLVHGLLGKLVLRLLGKVISGLLGKLVGLPGGAACPSFSHVDQLLLRRARDLANVSAGVERRRPTAWPSTWATS